MGGWVKGGWVGGREGTYREADATKEEAAAHHKEEIRENGAEEGGLDDSDFIVD